MEIHLRDYLAGHVLWQGVLLFEDGMGLWVKREAREHLNRKLGVDPNDDARAAAAHAADVAATEKELAALTQRHEELCAKLVSCAKDDKAAVMKARKEIGLQLNDLKDQGNPAPPVPRWVEACRAFFGPKMKKHVHADSRWDVLMIVSVMRALLPDVFAKHMPDHFHAKELLDGLLRTIEVRNGRAHRAELTESDEVEALRQMGAVLRRCGCDDARADGIDALLGEAKGLVERAREEGNGNGGVTCAGPTLSADDSNTQQLYTTLVSWELYMETVMGLVTVSADGVVAEMGKGRLSYSGGTVAFGRILDAGWDAAVKPLKPQFQVVAWARHWYFHNLVEDKCDVAAAFVAMRTTASAVAAAPLAAAGVAPWQSPALLAVATPTTLVLSMPSVRMSVPVACVGDTIVGRDATIDEVAAALGPGARVLVHGPPGVGKDTVMAEVAHRSEVLSMGGLQAWLQASSDVVFRRQLIELFATHRPAGIEDCEGDAKASVAAIKAWLETRADWVLFVEDASPSSTTLLEVLPAAGVGGCALVTSQSALESTTLAPTTRVELAPITTDESIELLRRSNVFTKKAPEPPEAETEDEMRERCVHDRVHCYIMPTDNEKAKAHRQRRKDIEANLFEHTELSRPELRDFLETTLGNLPLSVALCAQLLRADGRVGGVPDLIALFKRTADLAEVDRAGRNPMMDTHYFGLVLSVRIALDRLRGADSVPQADRDHAVDLLAMLSLLDRAQTPVELLTGYDAKDLMPTWEDRHPCYAAGCRAHSASKPCFYSPTCIAWWRRWMRLVVFLGNDDAALSRVRDLCVEHGLMRLAAGDSAGNGVFVGVMHQLVQRCLMWELVVTCEESGTVASVVRSMLERHFDFAQGISPPSEWPRLRRLMPCMQAWAGQVLGDSTDDDSGSDPHGAVSWTSRDGNIVIRWAQMVEFVDSDAKTAGRVFLLLLKQVRRVLPADHPNIAACMANLAATYSDLRRHEDALELKEEVLAFDRRVLPADHPGIAQAMHNLAVTYSALGRHEDACKLKEEALALRRRVLPAGHPHTATSMSNLAMTYLELGRHEDARNLEEEALTFLQRVLPADHPGIAHSMGNLAKIYSALGRQEDAHKLHEEALALHKRVLPEEHPDITASMINLAEMVSDLGRHEDARKLKEEMLSLQRRVLPADHPDIVLFVNNLAKTSSDLLRHEDALKLKSEVLTFRQRVLPADHPDIAHAKGSLALTYSALGRHEDARKLQEEALVFLRREVPADHSGISGSMNDLAATYHALGRYEDARKLNEEALTIRRRVLSADDADIATSMNNLAATHSALGRHMGARKLHEEALEFQKRVLPADHPNIATTMNNLASTYSALGRHEDARKLHEESLEFQKRVLPADHPNIATTMNNCANTYSDLRRHEDARKLHEEALAIRQRVLPADHPDIAQSMANVASTFFSLSRHEDARKLQEEVLAFLRRVLPVDHPSIAACMNNLATMYSALRRYEDARKLHEETLAFRQRVLPADHPDIAQSMSNLAGTLRECGDTWSAVKHMQGAIEILVRAGYSEDHTHVVMYKRALVDMTMQMLADGPTRTSFGPPPPPLPPASGTQVVLCPCASGNYKLCYYHL